MIEDISRMFQEEIQDKKRTGIGVHSKTGIRGYIGKMRFPSDLMSRKDKYNYRKCGKVEKYNMYEQIIVKAKFDELPKEQQVGAMTYWRDNYLASDIKKGLKVSSNTFYKILNELGLQVNTKGGSDYRKKLAIRSPQQDAPQTPTYEMVSREEVMAMLKIVADQKEDKHEGFTISLDGKFDSKTIVNKLLKFASLIEEDGVDYEISLTIKEVVK